MGLTQAQHLVKQHRQQLLCLPLVPTDFTNAVAHTGMMRKWSRQPYCRRNSNRASKALASQQPALTAQAAHAAVVALSGLHLCTVPQQVCISAFSAVAYDDAPFFAGPCWDAMCMSRRAVGVCTMKE